MKIKVGVIFGGKSTEHEISIISAIQALGSFNREKYDLLPIYITKNNEFYVGPNIGRIEEYTNLDRLLSESTRVVLVPGKKGADIVRYPLSRFGDNKLATIDVAFPVVHGTNVEDGTLQGFLQLLNIPYAGCDVLSSAVGMDKYVMKCVLKDNGIPVLDCKVFTTREFDFEPERVVSTIRDEIGFPVIVKPINLGSSIGISKADDENELYESLELAFAYASRILVESAVQNLKEINCSVLGDFEEAMASECEQPISSGEILDFTQKYIGDRGAPGAKGAKGGAKGAKAAGAKSHGSEGMASLKRKIPAEITDEQRAYIRELAVKAFKCLGCNGVSRIDFMMNTETGQIWLNEINTIPGSLSFYLWEPLGMKYEELLDRIISCALKRDRESMGITYAFDSNVLEGVSFGGAKGAKGVKGGGKM